MAPRPIGALPPRAGFVAQPKHPAVRLALRFVCYFLAAATTYSDATIALQKVEVKDRNGVLVLTISNIKIVGRSAPVFQGVVKNVSGADLTLDILVGTVQKKNGSTVQFNLGICDVRWCDLPKDAVRELSRPFSKPWPFTAADVVSVDFSLPASWQSPEDNRIAAEKKHVADAEETAFHAARKRLTYAGTDVYGDNAVPGSEKSAIVIQNPQFYL